VRALAESLGCPRNSWAAIRSRGRPRHPPAGRRVAGKLDILRKADAIYLDEIRKAGLYDKIWQAFAVLLPVQTVGVMAMAALTSSSARCAP